jgi:hypothetical protein
VAHLRHAFGDKSALPHASLSEAAPPGFSIGARHRREVDTKRFCQSAVCRQLLAAMQSRSQRFAVYASTIR